MNKENLMNNLNRLLTEIEKKKRNNELKILTDLKLSEDLQNFKELVEGGGKAGRWDFQYPLGDTVQINGDDDINYRKYLREKEIRGDEGCYSRNGGEVCSIHDRNDCEQKYDEFSIRCKWQNDYENTSFFIRNQSRSRKTIHDLKRHSRSLKTRYGKVFHAMSVLLVLGAPLGSLYAFKTSQFLSWFVKLFESGGWLAEKAKNIRKRLFPKVALGLAEKAKNTDGSDTVPYADDDVTADPDAVTAAPAAPAVTADDDVTADPADTTAADDGAADDGVAPAALAADTGAADDEDSEPNSQKYDQNL